MTFDEYQQEQQRTSGGSKVGSVLGLTGEAGEVADYMKKVWYHGHTFDINILKDELGDVLWYVSDVAKNAGLALDDVAKRNIEKLRERYPDGFDPARSQQRTTTSVPEAINWCDVHQVWMRQFSKNGKTWYSHKTDDGWCKGKA